MFIRINPDKINQSEIDKVVKCLREGGIVIYPTDSVYAIGCDLQNQKGIEKICSLKKIKPEKAHFTFICSDLSHLSEFTKPISNSIFKIIKRATPGPYTFILEANSNVPKLVKHNKKTIGIRIPDNTICNALITTLGHPILSSSLHDSEDEIRDYFSDPEIIRERYEGIVDLIIAGDHGNLIPTSIIDFTGDEIKIVREGLGDVSWVRTN